MTEVLRAEFVEFNDEERELRLKFVQALKTIEQLGKDSKGSPYGSNEQREKVRRILSGLPRESLDNAVEVLESLMNIISA